MPPYSFGKGEGAVLSVAVSGGTRFLTGTPRKFFPSDVEWPELDPMSVPEPVTGLVVMLRYKGCERNTVILTK